MLWLCGGWIIQEWSPRIGGRVRYSFEYICMIVSGISARIESLTPGKWLLDNLSVLWEIIARTRVPFYTSKHVFNKQN